MDQVSSKSSVAKALAVMAVAGDGRIQAANPGVQQLLGYLSAELCGKHIADIVRLGDDKSLSGLFEDQNDSADLTNTSVTHKSGLTIPMAIDLTRWDLNGTPHYTVVLYEVPSATQRETENRPEFVLMDYALRGANIGLFEVDLATQTSVVSETWKELMEIGLEEEVEFQAEWLSRIHPEDLPRVRHADEACLNDPNKRTLTEYRMKTRAGDAWRWMMSDAIGLNRDENGHATKIIGAQTDITDRKVAEEALRSSEMQLRSLIEDSPVGKAMVSMEGEYVHANPAFCRFLDFSMDELAGRPAKDVIHPDDLPEDIKQATRLINGSLSTYSVEKRYIRKDGETVWGLLTVKIVRDVQGGPMHFITQVMDITERRRLEAMKKDFVATVSHELRTPVTSIMAALDLILASASDELSEKMHHLLSIARLNSERLNALVDDILTMQKLSSGEIKIDLQTVDLKSLVRQAAAINQPYADKYEVSFICNLPEQQVFCRADPARFQQIAANLMSNAAKFSKPGDAVELGVVDSPNLARFSVTDHGQGLSEKQQKLIFEPFMQVEASSAVNQGGTGLGLSITKQLVKLLGGSISVQSSPGAGSVFAVDFSPAESPVSDLDF